MKKLLIAMMIFSTSAFAVDGAIPRTQQEQIGNNTQGSVNYDRACDGTGKPRDMKTTLVVVGAVTTITETDGTNTYISTIDTSVAGTTAITPVSVNGVSCAYP